MINISPQNNCSLEQLIEQNMSQILIKQGISDAPAPAYAQHQKSPTDSVHGC